MRLFIILGILLALDFYSFQAIKVVTAEWSAPYKSILRWAYWIVSVALFLIIILAFRYNLFERLPRNFTVVIMGLFMMIFIGKLFTSLFLVMDDLRRVFSFLFSQISSSHEFDSSRSKFLSQVSLFMGALPIVILSNGIIRNAFRYKKHYVKIPIEGLPDDLEGLKIIQISDIHSGTYLRDKPIYKAIEMINEEQPDLVFFTGDLVNETTEEVLDYKDIFSGIQSKYGVYSTLGNHDYGDYFTWESKETKAANLEAMYQVHKDMGWDLLLNENRTLEIGQSKLNIIGVENISGNKRFHSYGNLSKAVSGVNLQDTTLLLSHDPTHWDLEVHEKYKSIDVTFSGHTHGMQFGIEIPGIIKWSPAKYIYPRWAGLYQSGKQYLYVNRGFGTLGYPGRVGILPEITVMNLTKA